MSLGSIYWGWWLQCNDLLIPAWPHQHCQLQHKHSGEDCFCLQRGCSTNISRQYKTPLTWTDGFLHAVKPLLPLPGYNHPEEIQNELVWVQNKLSHKEEEALVLMGFLFQIITWLHQHPCWHTGEGADRIANFFWLQCQSVWWTTAQTCPITEPAVTKGGLGHKSSEQPVLCWVGACALLGGWLSWPG